MMVDTEHANHREIKSIGRCERVQSFVYFGSLIEELVALLNVLEQHSAKYGLGINYNKTKVMIVDREHDNHRELKSLLCSPYFCMPLKPGLLKRQIELA
ncbi:unnamed protein product [Callosobruchus maculatus]|uniref:Reverse transcriptase domain-containing protein n=1 Tax=Callosobruchus maculatus TaxID=64391 RepID=A0A653DNT7_CALMS|nr:unnamed protein product [Callosobruchus maculatus]